MGLSYSRLKQVKHSKLSQQKNKVQKNQLTLLPVQITNLPATQPRSGLPLILTSPNGWQLQFQDLPPAQWLQKLMQNHNSAEGLIK
jgi:hypothetical protein